MQRPAWIPIAMVVYIGAALAATMSRVETTPTAADGEFSDAHFHLTNYIQEGIDVRRYLELMGTRVTRSTLFGIPLQQTWSYQNSGDSAPTYYLQSDAPLYYYSFTDAYIATIYRSLPPEARARFDPMINRYPDRFLFGTDNVAPASAAAHFAIFEKYGPLWKALTPETSQKVRLGNYARLFDAARTRVRAWEGRHVK